MFHRVIQGQLLYNKLKGFHRQFIQTNLQFEKKLPSTKKQTH